MLIYAILFLFYLSSGVVNCFDFENLDNDFEVIDPYVGEARFFGNVSNIFNSSLISIVAIFIGGIILFELALYALDVYYTQTYSGGSGYNRIDSDQQQYQYDPNVPLLYQDYPKYRDPYTDTYRNLKSGSSIGIDKILEYIHLAYETYETGSSLFTDINCQRRAVCEIYKYQQQLGELSRRARHSLDYLNTIAYLNMPDEINELTDELMEAKDAGEKNEDCVELFPMCDTSLLNVKGIYDSL